MARRDGCPLDLSAQADELIPFSGDMDRPKTSRTNGTQPEKVKVSELQL